MSDDEDIELQRVGYTVQTPGGKEDFLVQCARADVGGLMLGDVDHNGYLSQPVAIFAFGEWSTCRRIPTEMLGAADA
jgi:hypothetical protein